MTTMPRLLSSYAPVAGFPRGNHAVVVRLLGAALALVLASSAAPKTKADDWTARSAPYRVHLTAASPPSIPEAGWEIRLPDFGAGRPDMRDVVMFDERGKEIPLDVIWRGPGRGLLVLAKTMPADNNAAMLYFGGNSSQRLKSWTATRSLLLETRRLPAGAKPATFNAWQEAWKKSAPNVDAAAFVPNIFHADNLLGRTDHFLSRYTGWLKTGDGGTRRFYTLSDDVSYVTIAGKPALQWQQAQPPTLKPEQVPTSTVELPKNLAAVDYCHAVLDPPAAMVLGWEDAGKLATIPPEAWVHPGAVTLGLLESQDGSPVPTATITATHYLGFNSEWYVHITGNTAITEPWQAEWLWPDGRIDQGPQCERLWMSLEPVNVVLRLHHGTRTIDGRHTFIIPANLDAVSPNNPKQLAPFLELLEHEDATHLTEPARRAAFVLATAFLTPSQAASRAKAWLELATPAPGPWVAAQTLAIDVASRDNPTATLEQLTKLTAQARNALGPAADLLELDLRVFRLNDPATVTLVDKLRKSNDATLKKMALVRLGDYQLLNGRIDEAAACYRDAAGEAVGSRGPVLDRAQSLAIEQLLQTNHLEEARTKLQQWELQRPTAKLEADQLFWRARVMFLAGDWNRALQDLQTSLKVRPGSAEEIDVLFWQGRTLFELGRKEEARNIWKSLVKDYPKHERADTAKAWLEKP